MPIYKYTMKKYMMSWSTWIIIGISFVFTFLLGGWLPFHFINTSGESALNDYMALYVGLISALTGFLSIFTSIFAGFKSAQMFKDEVEDGTFLLLLSKPIPRSKIIFHKWLALQTVMLIFTFATAFTFMLGLLIFDVGNQVPGLSLSNIPTLRESSWLVALVMWAILTIFGLIFSSIALLLSTKLSTGSTIGIAIALGVVIPMTGIIPYFTKKQEVKPLDSNRLEYSRSEIETLDGAFKDENIHSTLAEIYDVAKTNILAALPTPTDQFSTKLRDIIAASTIDQIWEAGKESYNIFNEQTLSNHGLDNIGITTGSTDAYKTAWFADLNFQVGQIASIASDASVPGEALAIAETGLAGTPFSTSRYISQGSLDDYVGMPVEQLPPLANGEIDYSSKDYYLNKLIQENNEKITPLRDVVNFIFLVSAPYILDNFSQEFIDKIEDKQDVGTSEYNPYGFQMNESLFREVKAYVFDSPTDWSAQDALLTLPEVIELINRLAIVEINYISTAYDMGEFTIDLVPGPNKDPIIKQIFDNAPTYGNLVMEMNDNWMKFRDHNPIDPITKQPVTPEADPNIYRHQKQSYLIPEITKTLNGAFNWSLRDYNLAHGDVGESDPMYQNFRFLFLYAEKVTYPIWLLEFDWGTMMPLLSKKNIEIAPVLHYSQNSTNRDSADGEYNMMFNPLSLGYDEIKVYSALVALDKQGLLVKTESKPYVNKYGLLGFYAGLAFILVPLSYALIRRQDYR